MFTSDSSPPQNGHQFPSSPPDHLAIQSATERSNWSCWATPSSGSQQKRTTKDSSSFFPMVLFEKMNKGGSFKFWTAGSAGWIQFYHVLSVFVLETLFGDLLSGSKVKSSGYYCPLTVITKKSLDTALMGPLIISFTSLQWDALPTIIGLCLLLPKKRSFDPVHLEHVLQWWSTPRACCARSWEILAIWIVG